ncbi:MAG: PAS domain S-box protein [Proteobacteria bacterium]|nr:PAS domain S-box protein [Pseudomonadota bacterium]
MSPAAEDRDGLSAEQMRLAAGIAGVGAFELDLATRRWVTTPQVAVLFGLDPHVLRPALAAWEATVFPDDLLKLHAAIASAAQGGSFDVEIRTRHPDGTVHWLAGKGEPVAAPGDAPGHLRGAWQDITERKTLEVRLLAVTETLEARLAEIRDEARVLEILNRTGVAVAAELDLDVLVQTVTDAAVDIVAAQFGAFFYTQHDEDREPMVLYALSGAARAAFADFPMPRNTAVFAPTFLGHAAVRSDDIQADPRYGQSAPFHGMPPGHLPVRSYLAVPVVSRSGEVLGGLFFGHADPGVFTERSERIVRGIAAQAAIGIDNAHLFRASRQQLDGRRRAEAALQALNAGLEERVHERTQQLEASLEELRESERRFRLLVESVLDCAIFQIDVTGTIVKWNPGAERLSGYAAAEIVGRHFSCFYTPEDLARGVPEQLIASARSAGRHEDEGWRVRKDGSRFWANATLHAIRDEQGTLLGFAKITRDLTEKREAEERARQSQKLEAVGQLTGGVAHDFNNLLTVIGGNLETLQRRLAAREDAPLRQLVNSALIASSRAAILTQQLLAFSRRQPLQPKPVSVNTLISDVSDMLRRTLAESIVIETVLAGGVWLTHVDANQLESCVLNLAVNARDAMPDGGKLTIESANVHLDETYARSAEVNAGQYVGIFVSDTGTGMAAEVVAKAFEPFFTTKEVGHGTGLGLSQVYGFVRQSGGHVKIYSEVGAGTTIKIYLPRLMQQDEPRSEPAAPEPIPGGRGEIVLVVEDETEVRHLSVELLRELGYEVLEAPNGAAALRLIDRHPDIALVFTDVGLPGGMNGRQLADAVRRRRPELKILFTTGYARNAIVHHGRLDPGVELITKPFTFTALATKLRQVLERP